MDDMACIAKILRNLYAMQVAGEARCPDSCFHAPSRRPFCDPWIPDFLLSSLLAGNELAASDLLNLAA